MAGYTYRQLCTTWESAPPPYSTEDAVGPRAGLDASEGEPGRLPVVVECDSVAVRVIIL